MDSPMRIVNLWRDGQEKTLTGSHVNRDGDILILTSPDGKTPTYVNLKAWDYVFIDKVEE